MATVNVSNGLVHSTGAYCLSAGTGGNYVMIHNDFVCVPTLCVPTIHTTGTGNFCDLTVSGDLTVQGTTTTLNTTVTSTSAMCITNSGTGPALQLNQTGTQPIVDFQDDGSSAFYIEDGGNVGIGTTNPRGALEIYENSDSTLRTCRYTSNGIKLRAADANDSRIRLAFDAYLYDFTNGNGSTWLYITPSGEVGIGTTSPYTKLQVDNTLGIYSTDTTTGGQIYLGSSDFYNANYYNSAPGIGAIISTGCSQPNGLGFYTYTGSANSRTERMRIEDDGNVGIGTNNPGYKLDVATSNADGIKLNHSDGWPSIVLATKVSQTCAESLSGHSAIFTTTPNTSGDWPFNTANGEYGALVLQSRDNGNSGIVLRTGTGSGYANRLVVRESGNVGIGVTNPDLQLHVKSSSGNSNLLLQRESYTPWQVSAGSTYLTFLQYGGSELVRIQNTGNVGIGTASPERKLHVFKGESGGQTSNSDSSLVLENSSHTYLQFLTPSTVESGLLFGDGNNDVGALVYDHADDDMRFIVNAGVKAVIDSNGNVGLGTTDPSQRLDVCGSAVVRQSMVVGRNSTPTLYAAGQTAFDESTINIDGSDHVVGLRMTALRTTGSSTYEIWADNTALHFDTMNGGRDFVFNSQGGSSDYCNQVWIMQPTGNVGIGTSSPATKLHVSSTSSSYLTIQNTTNAGCAGLNLRDESDTDQFKLFYDLGNNASCAYINGNGLTLYSTQVSTEIAKFGLPTNYTAAYFKGDVGIGTTSPSGLLHLQSDGGDACGSFLLLKHANNNNTDIIGTIEFANNLGKTACIQAGTTGHCQSGYMSFSTELCGTASEVMRISEYANVGIGTTDPTHKLDVRGDVVVKGGSTQHSAIRFRRSDVSAYDFAYIGFETLSAANDDFLISSAGNGNPIKIQAGVSDPILFYGNTTEYARFDGSGNLGIGTASPATKLHIEDGPILLTDVITYAANQDSAYLIAGTSGYTGATTNWNTFGFQHKFKSDGNGLPRVTIDTSTGEKFYVDNNGKAYISNDTGIGAAPGNYRLLVSGNLNVTTGASLATACGCVGIGTTVPGHQLHLYGADAEFEIQRTGTYADTINFGMPSGVPTIVGGTDLALGGNGTWSEAVRIKSTGNVGIGTTDPGSKLHIDSGSIQFDKTNTASGGDFDFIKMGYNGSWSNNANGLAAISVDDGGGIVGRYGITYDNFGKFVITDLYNSGYGASGDVFEAKGDGKIVFNKYGSCTFSGTPTMFLTTDSSGNIIEEAFTSVATGGSGTTGYIPKWTSSLCLGDSILKSNANNVILGGCTVSSSNVCLHLSSPSSSYNPSILFGYWTGSYDSGMWRITSCHTASCTLAIEQVTSGSAATDKSVYISSCGRVGIGETTPLGKLHVKDGSAIIEQGDLYISSSSGAESGEDGGGTGKPTLYFGESEGTTVLNWSMGWRYDGDAQSGNCNMLYTVTNAGSSADGHLTVQYGGNIGIGTTTPGCRLDIINGAIRISSSGETKIHFRETVATDTYADRWTIGNDDAANNAFVISCGANLDTPRLVVEDTGNVGIGTTDPGGILELRSSTANCMLFGYPSGSGSVHKLAWDSSKVYICADPAAATGSSEIRLSVDNQTIMSLTSNVGIGSVVPAYPFEVCRDTSSLISRIYNTNTNGEGVLIRAGDASCKTRAFQVAATDDTKRFTINSDGTVGIGITNPTNPLEVQFAGDKGLMVRSTSCHSSLYLHACCTATAGNYIRMHNQAKCYWINHQYNGCLVFRPNATSTVDDQIYFNQSSWVGIGTDPDHKLHVAESGLADIKVESTAANWSARFMLKTTTGDWRIGTNCAQSDNLWIYDGNAGSYRVAIDSSGNVGIGTTDPSYKLHIPEDNTAIIGDVKIGTWEANNTYFGIGHASYDQSNGGNYALIQASSSNAGPTFLNSPSSVRFRICNNEKMCYNSTLFCSNIPVQVNSTIAAFCATIGSCKSGMINIVGPSTGNTIINSAAWGIVIGPNQTRSTTANTYYPGIAFNHLYNFNSTNSYGNAPQAWIGTRLHDTPGSERDYLVFATKSGCGCTNAGSDIPQERMAISPEGNVGIGTTDPGSCKLQVQGESKIVGKLHVTSSINLCNTNLCNANHITINDPGADEGLSWNSTTGGWMIDVSPLNRSNADGNLNLYNSSSNNIALWRPQLWVYDASNYATGTANSDGSLTITSTNSGDTIFSVDGTNGTLFSVVDDLSDSLMSVNDAAGLPVLEVFADSSVCAGRYGCSDFYIACDGAVGIGTTDASTVNAPSSGGNGGVTKLHVVSAPRTTAFSASDGTTWHDVVVRNPTNSSANLSVGLSFELNDNYHENAGTGIAAIKSAAGDYGAHLAFITRPTSAVAQERMRITCAGHVGIGTTDPGSYIFKVYGTCSYLGQYADVTCGQGAFRFHDGTTFRGGLGTDCWAHSGSSSDITLYVSGDNDYFISTNNTKRFCLHSSGACFYNISGTAGSPVLGLSNTASSTFIHTVEAFSPNMTSGQTNVSVIGKAATTKNSGYLGYYWTSDASNSNFVSIGHWGSNHIFRVYGDGTTCATSNLSTGGNVIVGNNLNLNASNPTLCWSGNRLYMHTGTSSTIGIVTICKNPSGTAYSPRFEINDSSDATRIQLDSCSSSSSFVCGTFCADTLCSTSLAVGGSAVFGCSIIDPDSYASYAGGFGDINDGGGWGARGVFVHGGGTGDAAAMAHNGNCLYFGIQNGTANSMNTWLKVDPGRSKQFEGATTFNANVLVCNTSCTTASLFVQNSGGHGSNSIGCGALLAKFCGESDSLEIRNLDTGDYSIFNPQQNNGIVFYDGTGGVRIYYNGACKLNVDSSGITMCSGILNCCNYIGVGDICSCNDIVAGTGTGGVALTTNDGYGNANVTFNHKCGVPEQAGNSGRIEVNTDGSGNACMAFELSSNVTSGVALQTSSILTLYCTSIVMHKTTCMCCNVVAPKLVDSNNTACCVDPSGTSLLNNLTVNGNLTVQGTTTTLNTEVCTTSAMEITNAGTGPALVVNQTGSQPVLNIQDDGTSVFYIEDGGNVGIGTTNPVTPLDICDSIASGVVCTQLTLRTYNPDFIGACGGNGILFKNQDSNNSTNEGCILAITRNDSAFGDNDEANTSFVFRMTDGGVAQDNVIFTGDGRVGIGTTNPIQALDVRGSIYMPSGQVLTWNNGDADIYSSSCSLIFRTYTGSSLTEKMRICGNGNVGIGINNPSYKLHVCGSFAATTKSFVIDHPSDPNKLLRYGSLEGPENGVYVRGRCDNCILELPDYWTDLVHEDSITVQITPIGRDQCDNVRKYSVDDVVCNKVHIYTDSEDSVYNYFYNVYGERKDVDKITVEEDK